MIAKETGMSQMDSFYLFSHSKTHAMLLDKSMEMWHFSPQAILEIYHAEVETGDPRNSFYITEA